MERKLAQLETLLKGQKAYAKRFLWIDYRRVLEIMNRVESQKETTIKNNVERDVSVKYEKVFEWTLVDVIHPHLCAIIDLIKPFLYLQRFQNNQ